MKKLLSVLILLSLVTALLVIPASAKANVVKVWFEGENVKVRAGADLDALCDNKILSEENATANDFNKAGIVLVQNTNMMSEENTTATLYFELDTLQDIDSVYLTWYVYHSAIIGLPHNNNLIIGYSEDGEIYTEIAAYDFEGEAVPESSFQLETVIRLGQTVKAKYVSVSFEYGPHGQDGWYCPMWEWVGFTEVGAGLEIEEVLGGGYDEVSEDNTPLEEIEPIVEIPEGYVGLKHAKFNTSITTGSYTVITDPAAMHDFNVKWTSCALIRPTETEGQYTVVAVQWLNGDDTFLFEAEEGDMVLSVHGDDDSDGTKANRLALSALVEGDVVTFAGYNFEEETYETGAVVYFIDNTATPEPEVSEDEVSAPADDSSEPEDESSEPAEDESSEPAEDGSSSAPAVSEDDKSEEKGGNTGLIIGIVAVVVVVAVIVVVVVAVKKKK